MADGSYQIEIKEASKNGYYTPAESNANYRARYSRDNYIVHWWGAPGQVGNHDQTVAYIQGQAAAGNMSVNYVVSDEKITMLVPPDMVSWGAEGGNPNGVNVEHCPTLGAEGYKKAGWLKQQLEQRFGHQLALKKHSDYFSTTCPGTIDLSRIEAECQKWRSGAYDAPAPAPVAAPAPAPAPTAAPQALSFRIEFIPEKTVRIKIPRASLWDLNRRDWKSMSDNPVGEAGFGTPFKTSAIAHHVLGGNYYMLSPNERQGYNVADCEDVPVVAAPASPAAPDAPKTYTTNTVDGVVYEAYAGDPRRMYVTKQPSAEKWDFSNVKHWRDFKEVDRKGFGQEVYIAGVAHHPIPPNGATYYMTTEDFGDFKRTGRPVQATGFNKTDLSTTKPAAPVMDIVAPSVAAAPVAPAELAVPATPTTDAWKQTYRPFINKEGVETPVMYVTLSDCIVSPLDGNGKSVPLHVTDYILISGTFTGPDGKTVYGRAKEATDRNLWHGVPLDQGFVDTKERVFSTTTTPAERKVLGQTTLNDRLIFLADDLTKITAILEKVWGTLPFKNKKSTNIKK